MSYEVHDVPCTCNNGSLPNGDTCPTCSGHGHLKMRVPKK